MLLDTLSSYQSSLQAMDKALWCSSMFEFVRCLIGILAGTPAIRTDVAPISIQSLQANDKAVSRLHYECFLLNLFLFINHAIIRCHLCTISDIPNLAK